MTLTDFLLARIAEDEAEAHAAGTQQLRLVAAGFDRSFASKRLAECEAKRLVCGMAVWDRSGVANEAMDLVLMALAMPYADHPDYREEWRP